MQQGPHNGVSHFELFSFWPLSIIQCLKLQHLKYSVRKMDSVCSQVGREVPNLLGPTGTVLENSPVYCAQPNMAPGRACTRAEGSFRGGQIIGLLLWPWYTGLNLDGCISCHIGTWMTQNMKTRKCQILGSHCGVAEDSFLFLCDLAERERESVCVCVCFFFLYVPNDRRWKHFDPLQCHEPHSQ